MPHHARASGWTSAGNRMWFHRCDQCSRRRLVGWYYEVYPPIGSEGDEAGWWWACADCLVSIVSDQLAEANDRCVKAVAERNRAEQTLAESPGWEEEYL